MMSELTLISREPSFGMVDESIYTLAVLLLLGGLITAAYAAWQVRRT